MVWEFFAIEGRERGTSPGKGSVSFQVILVLLCRLRILNGSVGFSGIGSCPTSERIVRFRGVGGGPDIKCVLFQYFAVEGQTDIFIGSHTTPGT